MLFTKTTRIHSVRILAVSPEILHTERDELALLSNACILRILSYNLVNSDMQIKVEEKDLL